MQLDPNDPVIVLCGQGMQAEGDGRPTAAAALFQQAWDLSTTDEQAAVAAHYLARHQPTTEATLAWNERALVHAQHADPTRVAGFFPSLHLTLGRSYEDLGDIPQARHQYEAAQAASPVLGDDPYSDLVRDGIQRALARTASAEAASGSGERAG